MKATTKSVASNTLRMAAFAVGLWLTKAQMREQWWQASKAKRVTTTPFGDGHHRRATLYGSASNFTLDYPEDHPHRLSEEHFRRIFRFNRGR